MSFPDLKKKAKYDILLYGSKDERRKYYFYKRLS